MTAGYTSAEPGPDGSGPGRIPQRMAMPDSKPSEKKRTAAGEEAKSSKKKPGRKKKKANGDKPPTPYEKAREEVKRYPTEPGVYVMHDQKDLVMYVGKARNLKARVRSYFTPSGDTRVFVQFLRKVLGRIEFIVTANEKEAVLLENNLIKEHRPRYNIHLRDDKNYLMIRLDTGQSYPRLETVRKAGPDDARYFGPYHSARSVRAAVRTASKHFGLRICSDREMATRKRPCLQYDMGRCPAPCVFEVDPAEYGEQVSDAVLFLAGRHRELTGRIRRRMEEASEALEFERAVGLRDQLRALEKVAQTQDMIHVGGRDQDVVGFYRDGGKVELCLLEVRGGRLVGRRQFPLKRQEFPDTEVVSSFLGLYYDAGKLPPEEVLTSVELEDSGSLSEILSDRGGSRVQVIHPRRGTKRRLTEMACINAEETHKRRVEGPDPAELTERLAARLRLSRVPYRMECFDISNLQGKHPVASMTVFIQGLPSKSHYRLFNVRDLDKPDDYQAMRQVLERRFIRAKKRREGWDPPDLLIIDGGKGQLRVAMAVLEDLEVETGAGGVEVISIAKGRPDAHLPRRRIGAGTASGAGAAAEAAAEDEAVDDLEQDHIYKARTKDPIVVRGRELLLVAHIRDEAHRFALKHHRKSRRKAVLLSDLDRIPGIGPTRRKALLKNLGSLDGVQNASLEELKGAGLSEKMAQKVHAFFQEPDEDEPPAPIIESDDEPDTVPDA